VTVDSGGQGRVAAALFGRKSLQPHLRVDSFSDRRRGRTAGGGPSGKNRSTCRPWDKRPRERPRRRPMRAARLASSATRGRRASPIDIDSEVPDRRRPGRVGPRSAASSRAGDAEAHWCSLKTARRSVGGAGRPASHPWPAACAPAADFNAVLHGDGLVRLGEARDMGAARRARCKSCGRARRPAAAARTRGRNRRALPAAADVEAQVPLRNSDKTFVATWRRRAGHPGGAGPGATAAGLLWHRPRRAWPTSSLPSPTASRWSRGSRI